MSSLKDQLARLEGFLTTAKLEEAKLSGGCKASAAKLRNALLEIGKGCYELRKSALDLGKAIPVKHRAKPEEKKAEEAPLPADAPPSPPELKRQEGMSAADVANIAAAVQELAPTPAPQPLAVSPPVTPPTPAKKPRAPRKKAVAPVAAAPA